MTWSLTAGGNDFWVSCDCGLPRAGGLSVPPRRNSGNGSIERRSKICGTRRAGTSSGLLRVESSKTGRSISAGRDRMLQRCGIGSRRYAARDSSASSSATKASAERAFMSAGRAVQAGASRSTEALCGGTGLHRSRSSRSRMVGAWVRRNAWRSTGTRRWRTRCDLLDLGLG